MYIKSIKLTNYRNHSNLQINDFQKINLVTGPNAAGKTNLIEAILRFNGYTKQKDNIIKFGENAAFVDLEIQKNNSLLKYQLSAQRIEEKNQVKKKQPLGPIAIVHFTPSEGSFFNGTPTDRRFFLDHGCNFNKKSYLKDLTEYQRIVRQKNNLLKDNFKRKDLIKTFNIQLVFKGTQIICQRIKFLEEIKTLVQKRYVDLIDKNHTTDLIYKSKTDLKNIEKSLYEQLEEREEIEETRGYCLVGPHRDDFTLIANNTDMSNFGSQGEKKTSCIALKLAQIDLFKSKGIKPLLILDDALSELDPKRRQLLLDAVNECEQAFITTTDEGDLNIKSNVKHLKLI